MNVFSSLFPLFRTLVRETEKEREREREVGFSPKRERDKREKERACECKKASEKRQFFFPINKNKFITEVSLSLIPVSSTTLPPPETLLGPA